MATAKWPSERLSLGGLILIYTNTWMKGHGNVISTTNWHKDVYALDSPHLIVQELADMHTKVRDIPYIIVKCSMNITTIGYDEYRVAWHRHSALHHQ